jgi:hypothetical protein
MYKYSTSIFDKQNVNYGVQLVLYTTDNVEVPILITPVGDWGNNEKKKYDLPYRGFRLLIHCDRELTSVDIDEIETSILSTNHMFFRKLPSILEVMPVDMCDNVSDFYKKCKNFIVYDTAPTNRSFKHIFTSNVPNTFAFNNKRVQLIPESAKSTVVKLDAKLDKFRVVRFDKRKEASRYILSIDDGMVIASSAYMDDTNMTIFIMDVPNLHGIELEYYSVTAHMGYFHVCNLDTGFVYYAWISARDIMASSLMKLRPSPQFNGMWTTDINSNAIYVFYMISQSLKMVGIEVSYESISCNDEKQGILLFMGKMPGNVDPLHRQNIQTVMKIVQ